LRSKYNSHLPIDTIIDGDEGRKNMKNYMGCGGQVDESRLEEFERSGLYVAEPKCDGMWAICVSNGTQRIFSRNGKEKFVDLPVLPEGTIVAGELMFGSQEGLQRTQKAGHMIMDVFDILADRGRDVTGEDDNSRREILEQAFESWDKYTQESFPLVGRWKSDFRKHYDEASEGLVLKQVGDRPHHSYRMGRNPWWIKVKKMLTVDMVVMDYKLSDAESYKGMGIAQCITCGVFKNGKLKAMVDVGSFPLKMKADVVANWNDYKGKVVEIKCYKIFKSGSLRHPSLVGLRDDKSPEECTWESLVSLM
jgi:hypothetical protein